MKMRINKQCFGLLLIAGVGLMLTGRTAAQTLTPLHSFTAVNYVGGSNTTTNGDGANPDGTLILSGNILYGTAGRGGTHGSGSLFSVTIGGMNFTNLHNFAAAADNIEGDLTNKDGTGSLGGLVLSGSTLYGTGSQGGTNGTGTIFAVNTDGTSFTNLYTFSAGSINFSTITFTNNDGADPEAGLVLSGNTLYGTTSDGGTNGTGTLFAINVHGTSFTILHTFAAGDRNGADVFTNSDGDAPVDTLILSGSTLYGTTELGGTNGCGTVFSLNTNGTGFTILHTFTGSDGDNPWAGLVLSGSTLYGATVSGGSSGRGTLFAVNTNGSGFTNLYKFAALVNSANTNGANPYGTLFLSGSTLYGTASVGGTNQSGTLFAFDLNGTNLTPLHTFANSPEGSYPVAGLILSGSTLYGTTEEGGSSGGNSGDGTVFSLSLGAGSPLLGITRSGTNVVLAWPASATGFTLEFATNLAPPRVWYTNLPAPVAVNAQNVVTNGIGGAEKFYRLSQ